MCKSETLRPTEFLSDKVQLINYLGFILWVFFACKWIKIKFSKDLFYIESKQKAFFFNNLYNIGEVKLAE